MSRPPSARRARVTSHDVAELAGVSQSAVSRVFRDGASVSAGMRQKVMAAAKQLGYRPNAIARGLRVQRSDMVAVAMLRQTNLDYPDSLVEIMSCLSAKGVRALVFPMESFDEFDSVTNEILRYQVDGVIIARAMSKTQRCVFDDAGIPVIFYGCSPPDRPFNAVDCDHGEGIDWLVDRLLQTGHQRYVVLGGSPSNQVAAMRTELVLAKLRGRGISDIRSATSPYDYAEERACVRRLLETADSLPDAIIAVQDRLAIAAIDEARATFRLQIPRDLSVVGFDGVRVAGLEPYNLTTVRLPRHSMAEAAVTMLLDHIENPDRPPEFRIFSTVPVEGGTLANRRAIGDTT